MNTNKIGHLRSILWILAFSTLFSVNARGNEVEKLENQIKLGGLNEASTTANRLLEHNPENPIVQFLYATLLERKGANSQAIEIYKHLIKEFPEYPEPFNNLAVHYASKNDFDSAIATLESAFEANPSYHTAYSNLQAIYGRLASEAYIVALNSEASPPELELASLNKISAGVIYEPLTVHKEINPAIGSKLGDESENNSLTLAVASPESEPKLEVNAESSIPEQSSNVVVSEEAELATAKQKFEPAVDTKSESTITGQPSINVSFLDKIKNRVSIWASAWSHRN